MTPAKGDTAPAEPEPKPQVTPAPAVPAAPTEASRDTDSAMFEPFPGEAFFHGGRTSPIVAAAARRLAAEGCWQSQQRPGQDWTRAHRKAFAAWQETLRPKGAGNVSGIPDEVSWDKLRVLRVSPVKGD
ncbi:peptidoglycan-binding protein [Streptomyces sp. 8L]|uniref:peptidoglycan-binding protein n=1 Tax=Streptomyces sp. 8L TaxID=2877242 RepID=UPI001CD3C9D1|nr:peptidoglycan-binding protein [Streptomyces sp. 8L]MCA1220242.1 peptidoglycan-binding protein [Streptomyces sp. 8L]